MLIVAAAIFPSQDQLFTAEAAMAEQARASANSPAFIVYTTVTVTTACFSRHFIRQAMEVGVMSVLDREYQLGPFVASYIIGGTVLVFALYTLALAFLSKRYSDSFLISVIHVGEILGAVLLFRATQLPDNGDLTALTLGICILYSNNCAQAGFHSSQMGKNYISSSAWLNADSLMMMYHMFVSLGYLFGPVSARALLEVANTQNTIGLLILAVTLLQLGITVTYFHCPLVSRKPVKYGVEKKL